MRRLEKNEEDDKQEEGMRRRTGRRIRKRRG